VRSTGDHKLRVALKAYTRRRGLVRVTYVISFASCVWWYVATLHAITTAVLVKPASQRPLARLRLATKHFLETTICVPYRSGPALDVDP